MSQDVFPTLMAGLIVNVLHLEYPIAWRAKTKGVTGEITDEVRRKVAEATFDIVRDRFPEPAFTFVENQREKLIERLIEAIKADETLEIPVR